MSSTFKRPTKRTKRLTSGKKDEPEPEITSVEDLLTRKKSRIEREKTLESLFQELEQEKNQEDWDPACSEQDPAKVVLETKILFDDEFLLESDEEDVLEEVKLKETAKHYLEPEAQHSLEQAFQETKQEKEVHRSETGWKRPFFKSGTKHIRQPCLISKESTPGEKEIHLSELSATSEGRAFLLASGCMKDWHNSAWKCPHYIYQWLFEVVALEPDKTTARNALSTLLALWALPGERAQAESLEVYQKRYIQLDTFKSVLSAYHAFSSELVDSIHRAPSVGAQSSCIEEVVDEGGHHQSRHIPLSQLGLMVKAFGFSVRLWKNAYKPWEIRYTIRLLLQLSLDKAGRLILQEIQTSIDNCLSALKDTSWEIDIKNIANDICDLLVSTKQQVHLLDTVKTIYKRSRQLRRVIGVTCLERCLEEEIPGSIDTIPTDKGLIQQAAAIFRYPGGFFSQKRDLDYEECWIRIAMLDAAIGTDDNEILLEKETVYIISDELRLIGQQIGK
ncbi:hypothetical protein BY458DRAFT_316530 [Sporodiniella umbellata]|nr:hypothetical protein BY458DRAFT_316530 [Sporodiniella umbellata]